MNLSKFGKYKKTAKASYLQFVAEGVKDKRRKDLPGVSFAGGSVASSLIHPTGPALIPIIDYISESGHRVSLTLLIC